MRLQRKMMERRAQYTNEAREKQLQAEKAQKDHTLEEGVLKFKELVADATQSVRGGQHLRFIHAAFRTTEVCLAALRHETGHNSRPYDIGSVPVALIDEVTRLIKAERPNDTSLHAYLDQAVADKKADAAEPGYFDEPWRNTQDVMDHYGAATWEEMLEKSFLESWMTK